MNGGPENGAPRDDVDTGAPIEALARLRAPVAEGFLDRLVRRIERRALGKEFLSLGWTLPLVILVEFLAMIFEFLGFARDRNGGSP